MIFPEPIKDFMRVYLQPYYYKSEINEEFKDVISLEDNILNGKLVYDKDVNKIIKIIYATMSEKVIPIHCASASVIELLPLIKLLKFSKIVKKGSFIIIEEPEAHLLLIITHSPYILQQINNCMKLHCLKENMENDEFDMLLKTLGFGNLDVLNPKKVAPYLFVDEKEGVVVKELEIIEGVGIENTPFYDTLLKLHEETEKLRDLIEDLDL